MIEPIQIIAAIFAVFALSRALLRFKDKKITSGEFVLWSIVWISLIIISFIPRIISFFSTLFGIKRPVDIIVYLGILILFYLVFRLYVKIEHFEQQLTKVVRELSFRKYKK